MSQTDIQDIISQIANLTTTENDGIGEEASQQIAELKEELYAKVKAAEVLFLTYNKVTGYPHVDDEGCAWIFSSQEYADAAVAHFATMNVQLFYKAIPNGEIIPNFAKLYTLGLEKIRLDNGQTTIVIERGKILAPPDWSDTPVEQIPVMNPKLQGRMIPFFQNLRNGIDYEGKKTVLQKLEAAMLAEVLPAKFLVPSQGAGNFANLCDNTDKSNWFPAFTDWDEFSKMYDKKQWTGVVMNYDEVLATAGIRGIVINPSGMNFRITMENKGAIETFRREMYPQVTQPPIQPETSTAPEAPTQPVAPAAPETSTAPEAPTTPVPPTEPIPPIASVAPAAPEPPTAPVAPVVNSSLDTTEGIMVVPMSMYPGALSGNLKSYMGRIPEIRRAYMIQVLKHGEPSYLVVVDFLGDQAKIFGELTQVIQNSPAGLPVILKEADSIGLELVKNTKPFYKKGLFW